MEELLQMCTGDEASATIKLATDWSELDSAREALTCKYGYVEEEKEEEEGVISFKKAKKPEEEHDSSPIVELQKHTATYGRKAASRADDDGWELYIPWKLDVVAVAKLTPQLKASCKTQRVGMTLQVQPSVKLHNKGNAALRLRIECLSVGVGKEEALRSEKHGALGYYPSLVSVSMKPGADEQLVVRYIGAEELDVSDPTTVSSSTKVQATLSMTPALMVEHGRSKEEKVKRQMTKVSVERVAGAAHESHLEWRIQKWKSGGRSYNHASPHGGLKAFGTPTLPFQGATVRLDGQFPDVEWKVSPDSLEKLAFQVRIKVQMDLVWFRGSKLLRGFSSVSAPVEFSGEWLLRTSP